MTENMVGAICAAVAFSVFIRCIVWLINRREERDVERLFLLKQVRFLNAIFEVTKD